MAYNIADEPFDTPWRHYVVNPSGPLLAAMLCGAWLALPWFAVNAIAMGSPTRRKEIGLCIVTFVVTGLLAVLVLLLRDTGIIESRTVLRFAVLGIVTWKLGMAYVIHTIQARTFSVYEYYDGPVRSATYVLATGYALRDFVVALSDHPVWEIIVTGGV